MRYELHTEIDIAATPEIVWQVLTDLDAYGEWNPFITSAVGSVAVGETLVNRMQPPGAKATTVKPQVTMVDFNTTFEWRGTIGSPSLFKARHRFDLERSATGTRLVQSEVFCGALVRLFRRSLDTNVRAGFEAMNLALKARSEAHVAA